MFFIKKNVFIYPTITPPGRVPPLRHGGARRHPSSPAARGVNLRRLHRQRARSQRPGTQVHLYSIILTFPTRF